MLVVLPELELELPVDMSVPGSVPVLVSPPSTELEFVPEVLPLEPVFVPDCLPPEFASVSVFVSVPDCLPPALVPVFVPVFVPVPVPMSDPVCVSAPVPVIILGALLAGTVDSVMAGSATISSGAFGRELNARFSI